MWIHCPRIAKIWMNSGLLGFPVVREKERRKKRYFQKVGSQKLVSCGIKLQSLIARTAFLYPTSEIMP